MEAKILTFALYPTRPLEPARSLLVLLRQVSGLPKRTFPSTRRSHGSQVDLLLRVFLSKVKNVSHSSSSFFSFLLLRLFCQLKPKRLKRVGQRKTKRKKKTKKRGTLSRLLCVVSLLDKVERIVQKKTCLLLSLLSATTTALSLSLSLSLSAAAHCRRSSRSLSVRLSLALLVFFFLFFFFSSFFLIFLTNHLDGSC